MQLIGSLQHIKGVLLYFTYARMARGVGVGVGERGGVQITR
jgi:hypothetical protein